ncbi:hypothetical protein C9374_001763 [Naegleria lovaniensis]|uniref:Vesicle-fusing ATPase n=1 Tax=Naegleria lovaniensis TaxID=51637 RepID=A0AA88KNC5_NAELO|nr:uncharacterized protein C9374_001763 [Naegleria lovaniensis]KAG2387431.1 hypothetical protein C9374_001763 [Naegleria lovaniensis]
MSSSLILKITNTPERYLQFSNLAYLHPDDCAQFENCPWIQCGRLITKFTSFPSVVKGTIGLNKYMRQHAGVEVGQDCTCQSYSEEKASSTLISTPSSIVFELRFLNESAVEKKVVSVTNLIPLLRKCFGGHILQRGQSVAFVYHGEIIAAKIVYTSQKTVLISEDENTNVIYVTTAKDNKIMKLTNVPYDINQVPKGSASFSSPSAPNSTFNNDNIGSGVKVMTSTLEESSLINEEEDADQMHDIFNSEFTFETLGIGGLDKQLNTIFRRAFCSRAYPPDVAEMMGVKHVKGLILYGPPGTGKSLIAKQIGQVLNCRTKEVVNGPEIFSGLVGSSEKRIRDLFAEAIADYKDRGKNAELHLIIMDEIDAICRKRGSISDSTGVRDGVVNQLLTMMDGVESTPNVLVIGMTNRLDLLDPAMLRPGRFEVQIEIGLPNEEGRMQILKIHTAALSKNHFLSSDVDYQSIVDRTKNFTGSDIMGLVNSARSFAMNRGIDLKNKKVVAKNVKEYSSQIQVTMDDFNKALSEVKKPSFGVDDLKSYIGKGIVRYGAEFEKLYEKCNLILKQVDQGENTFLTSVLLEGKKFCGKTALAAHLALVSKFPYVRVVSPNSMIGMDEFAMCQHVSEAFLDAYKSEKSVVVLDNIERLIQLVRVGPRFSNMMLQTLMTFLKRNPPQDRKLLIIGTTSMLSSLESLDLVEQFDRVLTVPAVTGADNIKEVLGTNNLFVENSDKCDTLVDSLIENVGEKIPIKQLLSIMDVVIANKQMPIDDILELIDIKKV